MSRYRNVRSDISTDPRVAGLFEFGPWPALLYTWAVLHADDWGRLTGDARQFKLLVCPGADITAADVEAALQHIADAGLWDRYEVEGRKWLSFPFKSWAAHQSYINRKKLTCDGSKIPPPPGWEPLPTAEETAAERQSAAVSGAKRQSAAQSGPSPSPTPSPSPAAKAAAATTGAPADVPGTRPAAPGTAAAVAAVEGFEGDDPEEGEAGDPGGRPAPADDLLDRVLALCDAGGGADPLTAELASAYPEGAFPQFWGVYRRKLAKADRNPAGYVRAAVEKHVRRYPPGSPAWRDVVEGVRDEDGHLLAGADGRAGRLPPPGPSGTRGEAGGGPRQQRHPAQGGVPDAPPPPPVVRAPEDHPVTRAKRRRQEEEAQRLALANGAAGLAAMSPQARAAAAAAVAAMRGPEDEDV